MDPFVAALDALFDAPGSAAATYATLDGEPVPIRVIRSRPDSFSKHGRVVVLPASNAFEIRASEVAQPAAGDLIITDDEQFKVSLDPVSDVEGLTWTCAAEPSA